MTGSRPDSRQSGKHFAEIVSEGDRATRSRELLRTVGAAALSAAGASVWTFQEPPAPGEGSSEQASAPEPEDKKQGKKGGADKKAKAEPEAADAAPPPLEPEGTPDAAGEALLISHAWDRPGNWATHFGEQSFPEAKDLAAKAGLAAATLRGFAGAATAAAGAGAARVWLDCSSLPAPVAPDDHPSERLDFGPYPLPVRELKALAARGETNGRYSTVNFKDPYSFEGTMEVHECDSKGRIMQDADVVKVSWSIPRGWYYARRCRVVAEGRITHEDAASREVLDLAREGPPAEGGLRKWCPRLRLRDEVWTELTLGSMRAECFELAEENLALQGGLVAVACWNHFDRLWPLCEWALFCAARGPDRVQLAAIGLPGPTVVEFHRALRRLSVAGAQCRDLRDRVLLLAKLERAFPGCRSSEDKSYDCAKWTPATGPTKELLVREGRHTGHRPQIHCERVVDWGPVERYVRATAVGVFAREAALRASEDGDERALWGSLAEEFGFAELRAALRDCRPWLWHQQAKRREVEAAQRPSAGSKGSAGEVELRAEAAQPGQPPEPPAPNADGAGTLYKAVVEDWWTSAVMPVLELERKRALGESE